MKRDALLFQRLDAVNRTRALTDAEVDQLEAAIRRERDVARQHAKAPNMRAHWTDEQDEIVTRALAEGKTRKEAGALVGRSEAAVGHRLWSVLRDAQRRRAGRPGRDEVGAAGTRKAAT